jgi:hypothetical protein
MEACSSLPRIDAASVVDALSIRHAISSRAAVLAKEAMAKVRSSAKFLCFKAEKECLQVLQWLPSNRW